MTMTGGGDDNKTDGLVPHKWRSFKKGIYTLKDPILWAPKETKICSPPKYMSKWSINMTEMYNNTVTTGLFFFLLPPKSYVSSTLNNSSLPGIRHREMCL